MDRNKFIELGMKAAAKVAEKVDARNANSFAAQRIANGVQQILGHGPRGEVDHKEAVKFQNYLGMDLSPMLHSENVEAAFSDFVSGAYRWSEENPD